MTDHQQNLTDTVAAYRHARDQLDQARGELTAAVRAAAADGWRQADILRAIDHEWTREHLRKLTRS